MLTQKTLFPLIMLMNFTSINYATHAPLSYEAMFAMFAALYLRNNIASESLHCIKW